MGFLLRYAVNTAALYVAAWALEGISYGDQWWTLLIAGLVFTAVNAFVKPVITILSIPFIIITLGIAYFFVNLAMLLLTDWLVGDFDVEGFWSAVGAVIIIWLVNLVIAAFLTDVRRSRSMRVEETRYY